MPTETLLVKTKDNHIVAFEISFNNAAEKARLTLNCENHCKERNYTNVMDDFTPSANLKYDQDNTLFLNQEIFGYHWRKDAQNFHNGLASNDIPAAVDLPNTIHFDNRLPDDFYPEMIRQLGFNITPVDKVFDVEFNPDTGKYEAKDFDKRLATIYKDNRKIEIVRHHFKLQPQDYAKLNGYIRNFEHEKSINPKLNVFDYKARLSEPDKSLFNIYANGYNNAHHLDKIIKHELKHLTNGVFFDGLGLKKDAKRLSVENMYRLAVEDERSAYISQLINSLNEYLQKGDLQDFSMFDAESTPIVEKLYNMSSDAERLAYIADKETLLREMFAKFDASHKADYDKKQFIDVTQDFAKNAPLAAPEDTDGEWFKRVRSLYYHYQIYNPTTHRLENVSLAPYIKPDMEVQITPEVRTNIIDPQKNELQTRQDEYLQKKQNNTINPDLIEPAKALMRSSTSDSHFITEASNFRISDLYDDNYQPNFNAPCDHADWSDNLQQYWQKFDGYRELAKNNEEYTFKMHNATIRYTKVNEVSISKNADFDLYIKMLKEPSNTDKPVEFLPSLSKEQALMLYVACINSGRRPTGAIPRDLSGIDNLPNIPAAEINKFKHRNNSAPANSAPQNILISPLTARRGGYSR